MTSWLLFVVVLPAMLAPFVFGSGALGRAARGIAPWTPLPALAVALAPGPVATGTLGWLVLGARFGLDVTGQIFLLFTAVVWLLAGIYAGGYLARDPARGRYYFFHLLALCGNLGIAVAQDLVSFYLFFALMTFAAYGLVIHTGSAEALRAGRVYITMAVLGETLLLVGLLLAAAASPSLRLDIVAGSIATAPHRDLIIGTLLAGFGIKAGAVPLHVWLPLAHPVAPTPASAVLSGCMIKAGVLGWLRFLPLGEAALPAWSSALVVLGLLAAVFGVALGVTQHEPKTVLAYSSISQMGFLNVAVGLGLADPTRWPVAMTACLVYAVHHGVAKGALFLGVGVVQGVRSRLARGAALLALGFTALAVAGAPLTSGSAAKYLLKYALPAAPGVWPDWLDTLLPLTAVGTSLLMGRFLMLLARSEAGAAGQRADRRMVASWAVLVGAVAVAVWLLPRRYALDVAAPFWPTPTTVWVSIWPVVAGAVLLWMLVWSSRRARSLRQRLSVAPGDLLIPLEAALGRIRPRHAAISAEADEATPVASLASRWYGVYAHSDHDDRVLRIEIALTRWPVAALLVSALIVVFAVFLMRGGAP
jgi:formate hydrogenlyase subunit 3/multisubunit Na+/H+ antiporter MnhD subunit